jgi:putative Mg2+ transporter-C (MgtC) family protein
MEFFNIEFILRIGAALGLGFLLGLERELTNKTAGLRTHILVCLGACAFTIISIYGFPTFAGGDNVVVENSTGIRDTGRVAAQVVSGIGFIGAGAVLRNGPMIIGLTTAATLWLSAAIGMTCGVGLYGLATLTTLSSVAVLTIIRVFERRLLPSSIKKTKRYKVSVYCNGDDAILIHDFLTSNVDHLEEFSNKRLIENPEKSKVTARFELINQNSFKDMYKKLSEICVTDSISMQELND